MASTIGRIFSLRTFGESHGKAMGGILDGCPAGLMLDLSRIQEELDRRRPGGSSISTTRDENDQVEFLSGIFEGQTTGAPIGFIIKNKDQRSEDYDYLKSTYRPSHADYTYTKKYGLRDHRGGGRASVRDSVSWVVAGAIARQALNKFDVQVYSYTSQIGDIKLLKEYWSLDLNSRFLYDTRCPDKLIADAMQKRIEQVREEGDTLGGIVTTVVKNVPVGLGEPVFDKLQASLAKAMFSINAVKAFEYGSGFEGLLKRGSEQNDTFEVGDDGSPKTGSNNSGGIQGGITNGEDVFFKVGFKPVSTIMKEQDSINDKGKAIKLKNKGRHDPCVVPRAVPIVEAMTCMVLLDHVLMNQSVKISNIIS